MLLLFFVEYLYLCIFLFLYEDDEMLMSKFLLCCLFFFCYLPPTTTTIITRKCLWNLCKRGKQKETTAFCVCVKHTLMMIIMIKITINKSDNDVLLFVFSIFNPVCFACFVWNGKIVSFWDTKRRKKKLRALMFTRSD